MTDEELEATIIATVRRRDAAPEGSPKYRLLNRQIEGLRNYSELASLMLEDLGDWRTASGRLLPSRPEGPVIDLAERRRRLGSLP